MPPEPAFCRLASTSTLPRRPAPAAGTGGYGCAGAKSRRDTERTAITDRTSILEDVDQAFIDHGMTAGCTELIGGKGR